MLLETIGKAVPEPVVGEATGEKELGEGILVSREETVGNVSETVAVEIELVKSMMVKTNRKTGAGDSTRAVA